jgi:hypothetical protein
MATPSCQPRHQATTAGSQPYPTCTPLSDGEEVERRRDRLLRDQQVDYMWNCYSHTPVFTHLHSHTRVFTRLRSHTRVFTRLRSHTRVFTHLRSHTRVFTHLRSHTRVFTHLLKTRTLETRRYRRRHAENVLSDQNKIRLEYNNNNKYIFCNNEVCFNDVLQLDICNNKAQGLNSDDRNNYYIVRQIRDKQNTDLTERSDNALITIKRASSVCRTCMTRRRAARRSDDVAA